MLSNVDEFQELFMLVFGDIDQKHEVEQEIIKIKQGNCSASIIVSECKSMITKLTHKPE